jgi:hypothetical protein
MSPSCAATSTLHRLYRRQRMRRRVDGLDPKGPEIRQVPPMETENRRRGVRSGHEHWRGVRSRHDNLQGLPGPSEGCRERRSDCSTPRPTWPRWNQVGRHAPTPALQGRDEWWRVWSWRWCREFLGQDLTEVGACGRKVRPRQRGHRDAASEDGPGCWLLPVPPRPDRARPGRTRGSNGRGAVDHIRQWALEQVECFHGTHRPQEPSGPWPAGWCSRGAESAPAGLARGHGRKG